MRPPEVVRGLDGSAYRLRVSDGCPVRLDPIGPGPKPDVVIVPAFWDIQTNGRWGRSFSDPTLTVDEVAAIVRANVRLGSARLCPTLITAPIEATLTAVATIARACEAVPEVERAVACLHLEGPWISPVDGYRGAHPLGAVRDPDPADFDRLQEAAGGRIGLVTLAPERPGAIASIGRLRSLGVRVAIGHTAADPATIAAAASAGASLATHLGNGIAATLPRHPNPIWSLAADDRLMASFVADGHHLDRATLAVLLRAVGPDRRLLVSDASPLAGLPPGTYGAWAVEPTGRVVVAGTPYLAGADRDLVHALGFALGSGAGLTLAEAVAMVTTNPARLLGAADPRVDPEDVRDAVLLRVGDGTIVRIGVIADRAWIGEEMA